MIHFLRMSTTALFSTLASPSPYSNNLSGLSTLRSFHSTVSVFPLRSSCNDDEYGNDQSMNKNNPVEVVTLRKATVSDAPLLRKWDEQEYLQDASGDDDDWDYENEFARTDNDSWAVYLVAEIGQDDDDKQKRRPIGFVQIIDPKEEETHYWGDDCEANLRAIDIWIGDERCLGRGYGTQMMDQALSDYCFDSDQVRAVLVDPLLSNTRAHKFYQKLGFRPVGKRTFGSDECLVHRLDRADWFRSTTRT